MPLSGELLSKNITFHCRHCNRAIIKKGDWIKTAGRFKCDGCRRELRLTYDDKVALFKSHAQLNNRAQRL